MSRRGTVPIIESTDDVVKVINLIMPHIIEIKNNVSKPIFIGSEFFKSNATSRGIIFELIMEVGQPNRKTTEDPNTDFFADRLIKRRGVMPKTPKQKTTNGIAMLRSPSDGPPWNWFTILIMDIVIGKDFPVTRKMQGMSAHPTKDGSIWCGQVVLEHVETVVIVRTVAMTALDTFKTSVS